MQTLPLGCASSSFIQFKGTLQGERRANVHGHAAETEEERGIEHERTTGKDHPVGRRPPYAEETDAETSCVVGWTRPVIRGRVRRLLEEVGRGTSTKASRGTWTAASACRRRRSSGAGGRLCLLNCAHFHAYYFLSRQKIPLERIDITARPMPRRWHVVTASR